eukprot:Phypoly_transcript_03362.p1 GENE.Phypoly_transcript_03362~~Phypoly_transcript_03362.p1  ORF type:complete len:350 (+),score=44.59 Phypoly_transcript_03362:486-1535(+)
MIFLLPLKEAAKNDKALISDVELRLIFSYIETILNLHTLFCKELEDVVQNKEMDGVGNAFLKNWEFFKMYSSYVNGYNASLSTLAYCKHNYPAFDKFIEAAESNPMCTKLDLASFLIMPVQRLPRYILLLTDLLKYTPETAQDYCAIEKSISHLHTVVVHLNESKRVAENALKVFEIQQSLTGKTQAIMEPHRIFHSEGNCIIRTTSAKMKNMHYFLFNDMILLVSAGKSLFNKEEWRIHFQLLLSELSFSILKYEKGLLITATTLKLILILDDTQQMMELLDTLQGLKSKLPNVDPSLIRSLSSRSLPEWLQKLKSTWLSHSKLHFLVAFLAFLMGVSYWWMGKHAHK